MKKLSLALFTCLLVFLVGCGNEDNAFDRDAEGSQGNTTKKVRFYGVKQSDGSTTRGVAQNTNTWGHNPVITIKFLNTTKDTTLMDKIVSYAKEWEEHAGVKFKFVGESEKALVRIGFDWNDNRWITWSYTGSDAKMVTNQSEATASFADFDSRWITEQEIRADVLRVFGQVLGLEYEQRHVSWDNAWWRTDANGDYNAQGFWKDMVADVPWELLKEYIFDPLSGENITATTDVDLESIMLYPYSKRETTAPIVNYDLSAADKAFVASLYPKNNTEPTIQSAWVDAGLFKWRDEGKKDALVITDKGRELAYLPDVIDGEQLVNGTLMFENSKNLKKIPVFKSNNITLFHSMFKGCSSLTEVSTIDVSNAYTVSSMFYGCTSLKEVRNFNTAKVDMFKALFADCPSLVSIPDLITDKGIDFSYMFLNCSSLQEVPSSINTANSEYFDQMFRGCSSIKTIPALNTSNAIGFNFVFMDCSKLEKIPALDTRNVLAFSGTFANCTSLKELPTLNVQKAAAFNAMFENTPLLNNIELINFGEGLFDTRYWIKGGTSFLNSGINVESIVNLLSNLKHNYNQNEMFPIYLKKAFEHEIDSTLIEAAKAKRYYIIFQ